MKEIKAYIKKHKLSEVTRALRTIEGLTGMSVMECRGFGVGWSGAQAQAHDDLLDYQHGVKVEIMCRDDLAEAVVTAIQKAAHTGLKGDGKIYVGDIGMAIRISTGEKGAGAV
ncbi:MAG: P-II family nitrogen regulator [Deltaproteobacteria bacterium]|nr:P-II family nitrogen regulator [Deltaproteobacteria bacterium]